MKYKVEIRNGSLNNYITPGVYAVRLGDSGTAIADYPSELEGENSMMIVFPAASSNGDSYTLQVIMSYQSVLYLRLKVSSWERWYKVSLT